MPAATTGVQGRIDIAEQVRRRPDVALPLAVRYQEHDEDVVENRTLKAAATALRRLGIDDPEVRRGLRRIQLTLADVAPLDVPGASSRVVWSRLNERYRPAVALAQLVLDGSGIDLSAGSTSALSLTLSMPAVFEGFLERFLGPRLRSHGGTVTAQATAWPLDVAGKVPLRPDLVWHDAGVSRAVMGAKYQSTGPPATHGGNVYQLHGARPEPGPPRLCALRGRGPAVRPGRPRGTCHPHPCAPPGGDAVRDPPTGRSGS
ncbi:McrC family protein [Oerskovia jenensis]|uniref:5-methylcytosine-specific restriction endonuclease McrBC regulatory subunit McrC n=1 Tax=Oerskovia jenensis TaxID=162169 RepID=A0ABS2LF98_9CELL|nr:5-methylcytosine-specific restriction endonuclease McrBC regulatory subunit McrC [Oerskovia jenensis]